MIHNKGQKDKNLKKQKNYRIELEENAHELFIEHLSHLDESALKEKCASESRQKRPFSTKSKTNDIISVDLHGMTLEQAINHLSSFILKMLSRRGLIKLRIITGKGLNSGKEGGILAREIHRYILTAFAKKIMYIQESPAANTIDGIPIRGHFDLTLKP